VATVQEYAQESNTTKPQQDKGEQHHPHETFIDPPAYIMDGVKGCQEIKAKNCQRVDPSTHKYHPE
jgi:hypothetical protein